MYAAKLTFSETLKGIPNDKENAILCQTLVFLINGIITNKKERLIFSLTKILIF